MPLERPPRIQVLAAVMQTMREAQLDVILAELLEQMGEEGEPAELKIRWARNRYTSIDEKPCIALAFVSDGPPEMGGRWEQYISTAEEARTLALDIIVDVILPTEVEADELKVVDDEARLEILSHFVDQSLKALIAGTIDPADAPTALSGIVVWVEDLGVDDDEDLADIEGRLVNRVNVIYCVRTDDPTVLLRPEQ